MKLNIHRSVITKGFLLFVLLSFGVMLGIMLWTIEADTWHHFFSFQWKFIPLLVLLGTIRWYFDGMAFVTLAKHEGVSKVSPARALIIRLESTVVSIVVPMLVGVVSMHTYLLHREKLKLHESMAITVLRATLPMFLFLFNIPILYFLKNDPEGNAFFVNLLKLISIPVVIVIVFFVITLFYPDKIKSVSSRLVHWWGKKRKKHAERILAMEQKLEHEIDQFSTVFWEYLRNRKLKMIKATLWIALAFLIDYIIALCIIWGFGYNPPVLRAILMQFLMRPFLFFAFTPGGTGIWDFTYLGFFSLYMPHSLIGVSVLIWRLIINYLPCVVGAYFLTKDFRTDSRLKEAIQEGKLPEDEG